MPKISFGIIVLNGEPFTRYVLRALYPYAHQIIVVEGATRAARGIATDDGHSQDNTLETLLDFKANEDIEDKLIIVSPGGFWPEKDEMSAAYAKRATGDYLWQIDMDEFYMPRDIEWIMQMLDTNPSITEVSFHTLTFWGGLDYMVDGWYLRRAVMINFHRLFKWGPGYQYINHRPPTVVDADGHKMVKQHHINGHDLAKHGIYMYHYSLLLPKQVREKAHYYQHAEWTETRRRQIEWAQETFQKLKHPTRVHTVYKYPSWLQHYNGPHPPQVLAMMEDIQSGKLQVELRPTDDIEILLASKWYQVRRFFYKYTERPMRLVRGLKVILYPYWKRLFK